MHLNAHVPMVMLAMGRSVRRLLGRSEVGHHVRQVVAGDRGLVLLTVKEVKNLYLMLNAIKLKSPVPMIHVTQNLAQFRSGFTQNGQRVPYRVEQVNSIATDTARLQLNDKVTTVITITQVNLQNYASYRVVQNGSTALGQRVHEVVVADT